MRKSHYVIVIKYGTGLEWPVQISVNERSEGPDKAFLTSKTLGGALRQLVAHIMEQEPGPC